MPILGGGLLPASFRGVLFAALATSIAGGRRIAYHVYPGRDDPWAEDMGRAPRVFPIRGFLVEGDTTFGGGPIQLQRALLIAALEASGSGLLTHPTLGLVTVVVTRFSVSEELDAARRSSVEIEFREAGQRTYPSLLTNSSGLLTAANLCTAALAVDGARLIAAAVGAGDDRSQVGDAAQAWADQAGTLGGDATALYRLTAQLPGPYGRYAGGGNSGLSGSNATIYGSATTLADLIAAASAARSAVATAADVAPAAVIGADLSDATDLAAAIVTLVQALAAACADPADAIRLLEQLIAFVPGGAVAGAASGQAVAGMFQRAAAAALTTAVGQYQPTSADDAGRLLIEVGTLLDDLATAAADAGEDQSYDALRAARLAVSQDLRRRGAGLASIATFTFGAALPADVLAQRLYRDPSRADQLVGQVDPVSPLFMPPSFQALAA